MTWDEYSPSKAVTITLTEESGARSDNNSVLHITNLAVNATLIDVLSKSQAGGYLTDDAAFSGGFVIKSVSGLTVNWTQGRMWEILDSKEISRTIIDVGCNVPANGVNVLFRLETLIGKLLNNDHQGKKQ